MLQCANILTGPQIGGISSAATQSPTAENLALTLKTVSSKEYIIQNLHLTTQFSYLTSLKEQVM